MKAIRALLNKGADVNLPDDNGNTPLDEAKFQNYANTQNFKEAIKVLKAAGGKST